MNTHELILALKALPEDEQQAVVKAVRPEHEASETLLPQENAFDPYEEWADRMTHREYTFACMYILTNFNQRAAGRALDLSIQGSFRLYHGNAAIQQFISQQVAKIAMEPGEMLYHLGRMVRLRASKGEIFDIDAETGKPTGLNLKQAVESGVIELVKTIKFDSGGRCQVTFQDDTRPLDILTKAAGLQKNLNIYADIGDVAREAGMSEDEVQKHKALVEDMARLIADKIKQGENPETIVLEDGLQ